MIPYFSPNATCELNPFYAVTSSSDVSEETKNQFPLLCQLIDNGFCAFCVEPIIAQTDPEYSILFDMRDTDIWCYLSLDELSKFALELQILKPKLQKFIELINTPNQ